MQLGRFELTTISGGRFKADGGTMFNVVPRVLWSRVLTPDDENLIAQNTNCVLIRTGSKTILIDTGYGSKLTPRDRKNHRAEEGDPLLASLAAKGVSVDQIDMVILSHLHFDHAGGATRRDEAGRLVTTFPRAEYVAQRLEWAIATAGFPELRAAYPQDNLIPLKESGQLRLIDGDVEITPGIRALVTGGHTEGHSILYIESEGQTAVYLGDVCPTWAHLPTLWCMGFDLDVMRLRRIKPKLFGEIADRGWWALSDHDANHAAAKLVRDEKREFAIVDPVVEC
jgi:glyoxylase-like metal-dependent hydrolase (beta-lactamase superfamily II)